MDKGYITKKYMVSKSKYNSFYVCPKQFWLYCHRPDLDLNKLIGNFQQKFMQGNQVGELALTLFDSIVNVKTFISDYELDLSAMIQKTKQLIADNCSAIAEATFSNGDVFCSVDILKNNFDGTWDLCEVKSSTDLIKIYYNDAAFQNYVLTECGITVRNTYLIHINNKYIKKGAVEPHSLFVWEEISSHLPEYIKDISDNVRLAQTVYQGEEPDVAISKSCVKPYECAFRHYCFCHIPIPSVLDLDHCNKKFDYYNKGIVSFDDIRKNDIKLNEKQKMQVDAYLDNLPPYVDKTHVLEFLNGLLFPIYFLDFETYNHAIPLYDGQRPYQQIPFQYSLHILDSNGQITHKEFLADENTDETRVLAERLTKDIDIDGGSVVSYNDSFEKTRITELAEAFPDLAPSLLNINARMSDLRDIFRKGYVYKKEMGGSSSLKRVLPALIPDDSQLNYSLLSVKDGKEAANAFLGLKGKSQSERLSIRNDLLTYCKLDTYAMVAIYKELKRISE